MGMLCVKGDWILWGLRGLSASLHPPAQTACRCLQRQHCPHCHQLRALPTHPLRGTASLPALLGNGCGAFGSCFLFQFKDKGRSASLGRTPALSRGLAEPYAEPCAPVLLQRDGDGAGSAGQPGGLSPHCGSDFCLGPTDFGLPLMSRFQGQLPWETRV